jgi:hypothetical protein
VENWIIYDKSVNPNRDKTNSWEMFIKERFQDSDKLNSKGGKKEQKYSNFVKRIYLSMPRSVNTLISISLKYR